MLWGLVLVGGMAAHVPNIASYAVVEAPEGWHLDVSLSTDGMHQALRQRHPSVDLSGLAVGAYEAHMVAALREGVHLAFDGNAVSLGEAEVGLAPHETHIRFELNPSPGSLRTVEAKIDAFSELGGQNNVLRLQSRNWSTRRVLTEQNAFSVVFTRPRNLSFVWPVGGGLAGLLGVGGWAIHRRRRQTLAGGPRPG